MRLCTITMCSCTVVTCSDESALLEVVVHGRQGVLVHPQPGPLAQEVLLALGLLLLRLWQPPRKLLHCTSLSGSQHTCASALRPSLHLAAHPATSHQATMSCNTPSLQLLWELLWQPPCKLLHWSTRSPGQAVSGGLPRAARRQLGSQSHAWNAFALRMWLTYAC